MKCNPDNFRGTEGAIELRRWFEKTKMTFGISECAEDKKVKFVAATQRGPEMKKLMTSKFCPAEELQRMKKELWNLKVKEYNMVAYTQRFNELALMCPRMVKPESAKIDAYIRGLSDNIKGEVTSSKPTNLNEAVCMEHKLMEQKLQAMNERILEGNKRKWENFQSGNSSGNVRAMTTALNEGKVSSGSLPKVKQDKVREARGRAYAVKDAELQGSDKSFMDTRFSSMLDIDPVKIDTSYEVELADGRIVSTSTILKGTLDIDPVKIDTSYEVELADGRIVSTSTVLKGCTLNLVNHLFEIDLMPIELVTKKPKEKRLEDVPVIRNFPKVFLDELPRLPPPRQVEFQIDLVLRVVLVARAPYHLAPS
ncbi:putative reverse transcriptase domain-containing protein [Tanacetum coccineum]|uniref:Reverse transcriptase domain-containing protein n=1 Tax=Tanacetum coccineum TaxID=301880 RepID=A0ABQ4ZZL4_9ASTR